MRKIHRTLKDGQVVSVEYRRRGWRGHWPEVLFAASMVIFSILGGGAIYLIARFAR